MSESILNKVLERGVAEVIVKESLKKKLLSKKQLRVKLGIDPTGQDLHLGHAVVLRKLRHFQDAGHKAVLIIGDFTATVGDPSGRNESRPTLSQKQIKENMKNYLKEAGKIIDLKKAEVRYNSEWYKDKYMPFYLDLMSRFTIARTLERDDFQKRLKENQDISIMEMIYPLLQGYDSLAVKADVELGGTDQKFNLLMGRKVQRRYDMNEQDTVTVPLLEGTDGLKKMGKSTGNYIGLSEKPSDMYAKIMSIPDNLMPRYAELLTDWPQAKLAQLKTGKSPKEWKQKLAASIVRDYHGEKKAKEAEAEFNNVFRGGGVPDDVKSIKLKDKKMSAIDLLVAVKLATSKSEARRIIEQGGMSIDDKVVTSTSQSIDVKKGSIVRKGKRHFAKVA